MKRPQGKALKSSKTKKRNSTWSDKEDKLLIEKAKEFNYKNWASVAAFLPGRSPIQCSARYKRIRPGLIKGTWTPQEDAEVLKLYKIYGKDWNKIAKYMKHRTGKQIRDRFLNSLDSNLIKRKFTQEEDEQILYWYKVYGNSWSKIAQKLKGRTGDMVKNRFYSSLRKTHSDLVANPTEEGNTALHNIVNNNQTIDIIKPIQQFQNNTFNCSNANILPYNYSQTNINTINFSIEPTKLISYPNQPLWNPYQNEYVNPYRQDFNEQKLKPFQQYNQSQGSSTNASQISGPIFDNLHQSKLELLHSLVVNQITFGIKRETLISQLKVLEELKQIVAEKEHSLLV